MSDSWENEKHYKTAAYSLLTFVLLIFSFQVGFSLVVNILRNIDIYHKMQIVKNAHRYSFKKNSNLKNELYSFNSAKSLESIARNNLKMAGNNEILLVLNYDLSKENNDKNITVKIPKEKGIFYKR